MEFVERRDPGLPGVVVGERLLLDHSITVTAINPAEDRNVSLA